MESCSVSHFNTGLVGFMGSWNVFLHRRPLYGKCITVNTVCVWVLFWQTEERMNDFRSTDADIKSLSCIYHIIDLSVYAETFSIYWNVHATAVKSTVKKKKIIILTFCFQVHWLGLVTWPKTHLEKPVSHLVFVTEWVSSLPRKWQECLQMSPSLLSVNMTAFSLLWYAAVHQQRAAKRYFWQIITMRSKSAQEVANTAVKYSHM